MSRWEDTLDALKHDKGPREDHERAFLTLMRERRIEERVAKTTRIAATED